MKYCDNNRIFISKLLNYINDNGSIIPSITDDVNKEIIDVKENIKSLDNIMYIIQIIGTFSWIWLLIYNKILNFWFSLVCFFITLSGVLNRICFKDK